MKLWVLVGWNIERPGSWIPMGVFSSSEKMHECGNRIKEREPDTTLICYTYGLDQEFDWRRFGWMPPLRATTEPLTEGVVPTPYNSEPDRLALKEFWTERGYYNP